MPPFFWLLAPRRPGAPAALLDPFPPRPPPPIQFQPAASAGDCLTGRRGAGAPSSHVAIMPSQSRRRARARAPRAPPRPDSSVPRARAVGGVGAAATWRAKQKRSGTCGQACGHVCFATARGTELPRRAGVRRVPSGQRSAPSAAALVLRTVLGKMFQSHLLITRHPPPPTAACSRLSLEHTQRNVSGVGAI